jgi:hypothetical protein
MPMLGLDVRGGGGSAVGWVAVGKLGSARGTTCQVMRMLEPKLAVGAALY